MDTINQTRYRRQGSHNSFDPDADVMATALRLDIARSASVRTHYIPAIPLQFLQLIAPAGDAVAALLIALAEMRKRNVAELPLGSLVWKQVGNPSRRTRARLLRQIANLPEAVCHLIKRKGRPHLLVAGTQWPTASSWKGNV
jgi:hypothetical protein